MKITYNDKIPENLKLYITGGVIIKEITKEGIIKEEFKDNIIINILPSMTIEEFKELVKSFKDKENGNGDTK